MARAAAASRPEPAVHHEPELYPSRLCVDVEREDARVSLALRGEPDLETAPRFREHLGDVEEDAMTLVVDLRNLTFLDSCGIGELVGAHQRVRIRALASPLGRLPGRVASGSGVNRTPGGLHIAA